VSLWSHKVTSGNSDCFWYQLSNKIWILQWAVQNTGPSVAHVTHVYIHHTDVTQPGTLSIVTKRLVSWRFQFFQIYTIWSLWFNEVAYLTKLLRVLPPQV
jgi:hypothetical protein